MNETRVGLIGWGVVGTGLARLLTEDADLIRERLGWPLVLRRIADLDIQRPRPGRVDPAILTTDAGQVLRDPDIEIVIELIGGLEPARTFMLEAIQAGKHVVTANKALLATHGPEIFAAAQEYGVDVLFEASVGGCIPIVRVLKEGLTANRIQRFYGILNGTANYILTKMSTEQVDFDTALSQAQAQGFAEADPSFDIDGVDTAHKLALLVSLAYGLKIDLDKIYVEGIRGLSPADIQFADEFGYAIKLLAIAVQNGPAIEARVHPTMLPKNHVLSGVSGAFNAILFNGHAAGDILLYGQGAGMMPTASAVVSDVIELARAIASGARRRVPLLAWPRIGVNDLSLRSIEEIITHYYFRFSVLDQPGVLSRITGILGNHRISIKAVIQKGREIRGSVPVVMLTHEAREADVKQALREIDALDVVRDPTVRLRVEGLAE